MRSISSNGWRVRAATWLVVLAIGLAPVSASADDNIGEDLGLGLGSVLCSVVYAPVKVVYAVGGLIVGGFGWAFSGGDNTVATSIIDPAVRGDYIITPDILRGRQRLEFYGGEPKDDSSDSGHASTPDW